MECQTNYWYIKYQQTSISFTLILNLIASLNFDFVEKEPLNSDFHNGQGKQFKLSGVEES